MSDSEEFSDTDDESIASSGAESESSESGWSFSNTRLGDFLTSISGNKILAREDVEPIVEQMRQLVILSIVMVLFCHCACDLTTVLLCD